MPLQYPHVEVILPWLCTCGAESAGEATEHVHDGLRGDVAGCGAVKIAQLGDIEVFEGGVLVCGDDSGVVGWSGGEGGCGL